MPRDAGDPPCDPSRRQHEVDDWKNPVDFPRVTRLGGRGDGSVSDIERSTLRPASHRNHLHSSASPPGPEPFRSFPASAPFPNKKPVEQEDEDRADHRRHEASRVIRAIPAEGAAKVVGHQRAADPEEDGNEPAAGIAARGKELGDGSGKEPDEDDSDD